MLGSGLRHCLRRHGAGDTHPMAPGGQQPPPLRVLRQHRPCLGRQQGPLSLRRCNEQGRWRGSIGGEERGSETGIVLSLGRPPPSSVTPYLSVPNCPRCLALRHFRGKQACLMGKQQRKGSTLLGVVQRKRQRIAGCFATMKLRVPFPFSFSIMS